MSLSSNGVKKPSIVKQLNEKLQGNWRSVRDGFGWKWVNDQGREVKAYAESVMTYDRYSDDEFAIVYIDNNGVRVGSHGFIRSELAVNTPTAAAPQE